MDKILEYNAKDCAVKIKEFMDKFLPAPTIDLQLKLLANFQFSSLYNWEDYYPYGMLHKSDPFDEDATVLADMIYLVAYHDKLPDLKTLNDIDGTKYRGETINTFNNLFKSELEGLKEFVPHTEDNQYFYFKVLEFREKYLTMGNFMLLPNDGKENKEKSRKDSLNMLKQDLCRDYADIFFFKLYNDDEKKIKEAREFKANKEYFKEISNIETFCKVNFLGDYIDNNNNPKIVFNHKDITKPYVWYKHIAAYTYMNSVTEEEYKEFALNYINKSILIIQKRAELICRELKKKFTDFGII